MNIGGAHYQTTIVDLSVQINQSRYEDILLAGSVLEEPEMRGWQRLRGRGCTIPGQVCNNGYLWAIILTNIINLEAKDETRL